MVVPTCTGIVASSEGAVVVPTCTGIVASSEGAVVVPTCTRNSDVDKRTMVSHLAC